MKIKSIEKEKDRFNDIYLVTFEPNWLEKLFGIKEKLEKYKDTGEVFTFGGGHVYINQDGEQLINHNSIGETLDNFRRKW
jgi:hypothetical protein